LVYDGVLYYLKNGGILTAVDASGKILKQSRVQGPGCSRVTVATEAIYVASEAVKSSSNRVLTGK
jgi:hypothetical protein